MNFQKTIVRKSIDLDLRGGVSQYAAMEFIAAIYPGIGFACTLVLLILACGQAWIYKARGHARARDLALFCFFSALFASNIAITHSRMFSANFTWYYVVGLQPVLFIMFYYYMKSLSYFVAIPRWLKYFYFSGQIVLGLLSTMPVLWYWFTGQDIYFYGEHLHTGNFFVDSYTARFGAPRLFPNILLGLSSLINIIATSTLLLRVYLGSKDPYILGGLAMTVLALAMDHLMLPLSLASYVPLIFFSNMLEALRMCFLSAEENSSLLNDESGQKEKSEDEAYHNTSLTEERIQVLSDRLIHLMEESKIYENPNLKLDDLAHKMSIPSYLLSQVIRFGLGKNFYDLINTYRVRQVQELLADPGHEHETILDVAFQAGFNSKSSFNLAFKKITGQTPSEYRKSVSPSA